MRIISFRASEIHGYLDFEIKFFPDINFLTGINGSGKTSVLNGIAALISPSLVDLARMEYSRMEVEIETDEKTKAKLWTTKTKEKVTIGTSQVDSVLELPILSEEFLEFMSPVRMREEQETFYREQEAKLIDNPILKSIKALPTPMILDIERRLSHLYDRRPTGIRTTRSLRQPNVFRLSLHKSLVEASDLAEQHFRQLKARKDKLTEDFRKKLILSSIEFTDLKLSFPETFPALDEGFFATQDDIKQPLITLGLSENDVNKSLDPFFERLRALVEVIPSGGSVTDFFNSTLNPPKEN